MQSREDAKRAAQMKKLADELKTKVDGSIHDYVDNIARCSPSLYRESQRSKRSKSITAEVYIPG